MFRGLWLAVGFIFADPDPVSAPALPLCENTYRMSPPLPAPYWSLAGFGYPLTPQRHRFSKGGTT
jgi:hypothetical protein